MQEHRVEKGKHDYKPGHGNFPNWKKRGYNLEAKVPVEAWFDPTEDGPIGRDGKDWNKIGGVSFINLLDPKTWKKNSNSALIAWRPSEQLNKFEICAYTNAEDSKWIASDPILIDAEQDIIVSVNISRNKVGYVINGKIITHDFRRRGFSIPVGPWFGGNRTAPQEHSLYICFSRK